MPVHEGVVPGETTAGRRLLDFPQHRHHFLLHGGATGRQAVAQRRQFCVYAGRGDEERGVGGVLVKIIVAFFYIATQPLIELDAV